MHSWGTSQTWTPSGKSGVDFHRVVTTAQGIEKARQNEAIFMEVSAKSGTNVRELFRDLTKHLTHDEYAREADIPPVDHGTGKLKL